MEQSDIDLVLGALDSLGAALADHDHQWTEGERAIYDRAAEIVAAQPQLNESPPHYEGGYLCSPPASGAASGTAAVATSESMPRESGVTDPDGNPYVHDPIENEAAKGREATMEAYLRCANFAKSEHLILGKQNCLGAIEPLMNCHTQFSKWAQET